MQIKEILISVPLLCFIFWVFTAPLPQNRIERVCEPIHWVGNVATSTTALSVDRHTTTAARWSDKLNYSCQYLVWRLFYQDDYNKAVEEGRVRAQQDNITVLEADPSTEDPKAHQASEDDAGDAIPGAARPQPPTDAEKASKGKEA